MKMRLFGKTNLMVTPLAYGTAQIGILNKNQQDADKLLNGVLDLGINVLDTASCYGTSEELIGNAVNHRRDEYVLSSKCGHEIPKNGNDWTIEVIKKNIERSLRLLKTDHLDVLLLHSCSAEKLKDQEMIRTFEDFKVSGKTRFIGYSGDNEAAKLAVEMNIFDVLEISLNIVDQGCLDEILPLAKQRNYGVMAKRSVANACWRADNSKSVFSDYSKEYRRRITELKLDPQRVCFEGSMMELALRFTAYAPGIHTAIVGGQNLEHIQENIENVKNGPLPENTLSILNEIWLANNDGSWVGQT